jgi:hypothetical protein
MARLWSDKDRLFWLCVYKGREKLIDGFMAPSLIVLVGLYKFEFYRDYWVPLSVCVYLRSKTRNCFETWLLNKLWEACVAVSTSGGILSMHSKFTFCEFSLNDNVFVNLLTFEYDKTKYRYSNWLDSLNLQWQLTYTPNTFSIRLRLQEWWWQIVCIELCGISHKVIHNYRPATTPVIRLDAHSTRIEFFLTRCWTFCQVF